MPAKSYLDEAIRKPHMNEVYMDDVYRVTHSDEEYRRLLDGGWSPDKEPGVTYRPASDTPEAHQRAWNQADQNVTVQMDRLRYVADDEQQPEKTRMDARTQLNALKARRKVLDSVKASIFAEKAPAPAESGSRSAGKGGKQQEDANANKAV